MRITTARLQPLVARRTWCLAFIAVAAAGCAAAGATTAPADPTQTAAAATQPAAATTTVATAPDRGIATGWSRCSDTSAPAGTAKPAGSVPPEAPYVRCTTTMSDPRLTGEYVGWYMIGGDAAQVTSVYGSGQLTTPDGAWSCTQLMLGTTVNGTGWRDQVCVGHGPYIGLTAYIHGVTADDGNSLGEIGWIEPTH